MGISSVTASVSKKPKERLGRHPGKQAGRQAKAVDNQRSYSVHCTHYGNGSCSHVASDEKDNIIEQLATGTE